MNVNDINNLLFNPSWTAKLLHHFFCGACSSQNKKLKFELIYFALPFLYDKKIRLKLIRSKKTSSFATVFQEIELKECLIKKNEQIDSYKEITNKALICLGNKIELKIDGFVQIENSLNFDDENNAIVKGYCKAAYYWGLILAKEDYRNIFLRIGGVKI